MKIGITGAEGFLGGHLAGFLRGTAHFQVAQCERSNFADPAKLGEFAAGCDAVVHFAGLSRHADGDLLYETNMRLTRALAEARPAKIYFASTLQIERDTRYHASKRDGQLLLERSGLEVVTLLLPNVFGPYSRPFYNSVVSTFCALAAAGKKPEVIDDVELALIDVTSLVRRIARLLLENPPGGVVRIEPRHRIALVRLWEMLERFRAIPPGALPEAFDDAFAFDLWNCFAAYRSEDGAATP